MRQPISAIMRVLIWIVLISFQLLISCQNSGKSEQSIAPPEIPFVEALQKDVPVYIEQVGQVYGHKDIPIRARVDGFLEEIAFQEGTRVKKGQLLYRIDDSEFQERVAAQQSRVSEAQTRLTNAKNELERYKPLAEINAVSKSDLDAVQANYESAQASLKAARANLQSARIKLGYCKIYSPISGFIGKTEARVGEYVGKSPNPVILNTVSKTDTVRVEFTISESMYLELARKYRLEKKTPGGVRANQNEEDIHLLLSDGCV